MKSICDILPIPRAINHWNREFNFTEASGVIEKCLSVELDITVRYIEERAFEGRSGHSTIPGAATKIHFPCSLSQSIDH